MTRDASVACGRPDRGLPRRRRATARAIAIRRGAVLDEAQTIERARTLLPDRYCGPTTFVDGCDVLTENEIGSWRVYFHQYQLRDGATRLGRLDAHVRRPRSGRELLRQHSRHRAGRDALTVRHSPQAHPRRRNRRALAPSPGRARLRWRHRSPTHRASISCTRFSKARKARRAPFGRTSSTRTRRTTQATSGTFAFQRPGKFRWTYEKPFDQLIVGDGAKVWVFDRDLNQVIVRKLDAALGATPAALLAGDNALEKNFTLVAGGEARRRRVCQRNAEVGRIAVHAHPARLRRQPAAAHGADRRIRPVHRAHVQRRPAQSEARGDVFQFTPPKGADVVGQ